MFLVNGIRNILGYKVSQTGAVVSDSCIPTEKVSEAMFTGRAETPSQRCILRTPNGTNLYLAYSDLKYLKTIERMIQDVGGAKEPIPINICVSEDSFKKIILWCRKCEEAKMELKMAFNEVFKDSLVPQLMEIVSASLFLSVLDLKSVAAGKIASLLKGKTTDEMRIILGRPNQKPCSQEEVEKVDSLALLFSDEPKVIREREEIQLET